MAWEPCVSLCSYPELLEVEAWNFPSWWCFLFFWEFWVWVFLLFPLETDLEQSLERYWDLPRQVAVGWWGNSFSRGLLIFPLLRFATHVAQDWHDRGCRTGFEFAGPHRWRTTLGKCWHA